VKWQEGPKLSWKICPSVTLSTNRLNNIMTNCATRNGQELQVIHYHKFSILRRFHIAYIFPCNDHSNGGMVTATFTAVRRLAPWQLGRLSFSLQRDHN
jgi:hypothetical protein